MATLRGVDAAQIFFNAEHVGGVAQIEAMLHDGTLAERIAKTLAEDAPTSPSVPAQNNGFQVSSKRLGCLVCLRGLPDLLAQLLDFVDADELPLVLLYRKVTSAIDGLETKMRGPVTRRVRCFKGRRQRCVLPLAVTHNAFSTTTGHQLIDWLDKHLPASESAAETANKLQHLGYFGAVSDKVLGLFQANDTLYRWAADEVR